MDKPHLDPNTNLLTEEYMTGIGEFMALVQRQPEANTGLTVMIDHQQHSVVPYLGTPPRDPSTRYEPGVMPVATLVRQPCRDHLKMLHPQPLGYTTWFNKSHNDITVCINAMMYSMLRKGYKTYSVMPSEEKKIWFRNFADSLIRDVIDLVQTKKAELLASQPMNSDDDSTAASTNFCRLQINEMVEQTVPKKKERLVGLARRASSCPSSSQTPYIDPMIMEQLQNKDEQIEALETQNITILAELADQKKTNNEIIDKMKRLFPDEFQ
ncbi:hypothetical protein F2Q68_00029517 [Brassica cretica]|uniref:Uncharacterized protein n=1 Tax=Brassica cretica TaxID=69181 RepID=A0A8S9G8J4_BRACR|nr:hypothetical protein F2Q68_00029517 [Brassica cretica]